MFDEAFCGGMVHRIRTERFEDVRGVLSAIDLAALGFLPARAFAVAGAAGAVRGGHGHRRGRQILMLVSGLIDVELRDAGEIVRIRLDPDRRALLIEPPVWSRQTFIGEGSAMMVFCDTAYDPDDYILGDGLTDAPAAQPPG
jgi:dTDP-4-dehydrorhamnose 3,5-epimerase-like enzyme